MLEALYSNCVDYVISMLVYHYGVQKDTMWVCKAAFLRDGTALTIWETICGTVMTQRDINISHTMLGAKIKKKQDFYQPRLHEIENYLKKVVF